MKKCSKCQQIRDYIAFYRDGKTSDGYGTRCRLCFRPGYQNQNQDPSIKSKACPKCKIVKEITEFGKDGSKKSGYATYCKLCAKLRTQERYDNDPVYRLKRQLASRLWKQEHPERHNQHIRRSRSRARGVVEAAGCPSSEGKALDD